MSACALPPSALRELGVSLRQGAVSRPRHGPHTAEPLQYAVPPARRGGARRGGVRRGGASGGEGDRGRGEGESDDGVSDADARRGARRGEATRAGAPLATSAAISSPSPPSPPSPEADAPEPLECTREQRARAVRGAARRGEHDAAVAAAYGGRAAAWAEEEAQEAEVLLEAEAAEAGASALALREASEPHAPSRSLATLGATSLSSRGGGGYDGSVAVAAGDAGGEEWERHAAAYGGDAWRRSGRPTSCYWNSENHHLFEEEVSHTLNLTLTLTRTRTQTQTRTLTLTRTMGEGCNHMHMR